MRPPPRNAPLSVTCLCAGGRGGEGTETLTLWDMAGSSEQEWRRPQLKSMAKRVRREMTRDTLSRGDGAETTFSMTRSPFLLTPPPPPHAVIQLKRRGFASGWLAVCLRAARKALERRTSPSGRQRSCMTCMTGHAGQGEGGVVTANRVVRCCALAKLLVCTAGLGGSCIAVSAGTQSAAPASLGLGGIGVMEKTTTCPVTSPPAKHCPFWWKSTLHTGSAVLNWSTGVRSCSRQRRSAGSSAVLGLPPVTRAWASGLKAAHWREWPALAERRGIPLMEQRWRTLSRDE